jgi:hypothetical protein
MNTAIDSEFYENFAKAWLDAWNSHDLEKIMSHYATDFKFSSPVLLKLLPASGGIIQGHDAAKAYWSRGLAARPDLHFEPIALLKGVLSLVIHYRGLGGKLCAEYFVFNSLGLVVESHAHGE